MRNEYDGLPEGSVRGGVAGEQEVPGLREEGRPGRLFRAAAVAETVHAHSHLRAMGGIGSTMENLQEAVSGETYEFRSMYPDMIRTAEAEGNETALRSFRFANEVEKIHAELYTGFLKTLGQDQGDYPFFVCPVCGHTTGREAPESCPICGTKGSMYTRID
jgi:rubrerythrin